MFSELRKTGIARETGIAIIFRSQNKSGIGATRRQTTKHFEIVDKVRETNTGDNLSAKKWLN